MNQEQTNPTNKPKKISDLNDLYLMGDGVDQEVFAEQRSNLLLVSGEHYNRKRNSFYKHIRDSRELSQEQKVRLTKNHVQKICKTYVNNIMAQNPGVGFEPKDENSHQDHKAAQLHHSVWRDAHERYNIDDLMDDWCDSFVEVGEVAVKVFYDPTAGDITGYEPKVGDDGQPVADAMGQPQFDKEKPKFSGDFIFEEVYGFNLLRPGECKDIRTAAWLCIRKMVDTKELKAKFSADEEIQRKITDSNDETYLIYDPSKGGYKNTKNQTMVREFYFRACSMYPDGYFFITTKDVILAEGPLPGGIFPIVVQPFDKMQTSPRGRSPIKTMRPYQAEINRAASKIAEHQITLGDDKLLIQNGTKISAGSSLPGVRSVNYTGQKPEILSGRSGEQYLAYSESQQQELYNVMNVAEDTATENANLDPYILLFRSAKQKKKFQRYTKRFEKFLINIVKTYLKLAKIHMPDDKLIYAIGASEQVNIQEFKNSKDICYQINVEAQSEDIETKMGKQLAINHALQYVGSQLKPEDIGKIMRQMPFADFDKSFDDLTMDYDSVENEILSLDRGEQPPVSQYDNHVYCIKRLVSRMRQADFKYVQPGVQQAYQAKIQVHQQMDAQNKLEIQRAEAGFIPHSGAMVTCQIYVPSPTKDDPNKTQLLRLPTDTLYWIVQQLQAQSTPIQDLEGMNPGAAAQEGHMISQGNQQQARMPGQQPAPGANGMAPGGQMGNAMPGGMNHGRSNVA